MTTRADPAGAAEPPALDLPQHDGLLGQIVRLNMAVSRVLEHITGEAGITVADYLVLAVVRRSPGHCTTPTAIATVLGRTTGGMTLALDRLEAAGWVRRAPHPDDRRRILVELTPDGLRLATRVNDALHDWERSLPIPDAQRRATGHALDALTSAIGANGIAS